jgi:hypothetical protein
MLSPPDGTEPKQTYRTMKKIKVTIKQVTPVTTEQIDFGILDNKGRSIGLHIAISTAEFTVAPEDAKSYYWKTEEQIGVWFKVTMTCTRDGNWFGASQYPEYHRTVGELQNAIDKRKKSTFARYTKQFAKV